MNLLILGGTRFLGRHVVEVALAAGHRVTLFHRGKTNPGLFPQAETILGDRNSDLSRLAGKRFDAVIDTCAYLPASAARSAETLADRVGKYLFVSSISVYADFSRAGMTEEAPLATLPEGADPAVYQDEHYGALKVLCEQEVARCFGDRAFLVRPGLIVGPHDPSWRFNYWVERGARGGEVLAPGRPERAVQFIDVRDLAEWLLHLPEKPGSGGVFNATGPNPPLPFRALLEACLRVSGGPGHLTWVEEEFLLRQDVSPWSALPLWLEEGKNGMLQVSIERAQARGLTFRPVQETIAACREWHEAHPKGYTGKKATLALEREAEVLAAWRMGRNQPT